MKGTRVVQLFSVLILWLLLQVPAQACLGTPLEYYRDLPTLIGTSDRVIYGTLVYAEVPDDFQSTLTFRPIETLKGTLDGDLEIQALSSVVERQEGQEPEPKNLNDGDFWFHFETQSGVLSDCRIAFAELVLGQDYVVIVTESLAKLSITPVAGIEDSWYRAVVATIAGQDVAFVSNLLTPKELFEHHALLHCSSAKVPRERLSVAFTTPGFDSEEIPIRTRICRNAGSLLLGFTDGRPDYAVEIPLIDGRPAIEQVSPILGGEQP